MRESPTARETTTELQMRLLQRTRPQIFQRPNGKNTGVGLTRTGMMRPALGQAPVLISIESPHDIRNPDPVDGSTQPFQEPIQNPSGLGRNPSGIGSDDVMSWNRWLVVVQIAMGPTFVAFIVWANIQDELESPGKTLIRMCMCAWLASLALIVLLLATTLPDRKPQFHYLLCFLGFVISIAWISTVAGEVVGVLKAFGVIIGISEAILGLTIFAVGNSLGDLVADVTVARLGYPVMAL